MADWYVKNLVDLGAWWANFTSRRPDFENKYPVLKTKEAACNEVGAWIAYWVPARNAFDESSKQLSTYFNTIAGNDPNADPPLPFAINLPGTAPAEVPPGIESFIREIRREVVGMTIYAKADGDALGFESTKVAPIAPNLVKPTIQLFGAAHFSHFSIVVTDRGGATMWDGYVLRKGGAWTKEFTGEGKSADIHLDLTTPGEAEQIQAYIQLRKSNADYGQPSEPAFVTLNP